MPLRVVDLPGPNGAALTLVRPDQYVAWAGDREPADSLALIDQIRGAGSSATRAATAPARKPSPS